MKKKFIVDKRQRISPPVLAQPQMMIFFPTQNIFSYIPPGGSVSAFGILLLIELSFITIKVNRNNIFIL